MKLLKIAGFLPDTANSLEHSSVVQLKELIDDMAKSMSTTVSMFDVSKGTAVVGLADDKALERLSAQFAGEQDVTVSEVTLVSFQRELNRAAQEKVNKMRAKKAQKKA
jgi:hypothetical protein